MPNTKRNNRRLQRITDKLREQLPDLRQRYGVRSLGLFGSFVRGQQKAKSDLDVLVEFDNEILTLLQFIQLERHLSEVVGIKVDLVDKSGLKPAIGKRILQEVVLL